MTARDQTNWSPEQLEEWAKPALEHPELVKIARTATSNNEAKKKTLEWVTETHENLGQACRWLRILRVNYPERFEKLISQTEKKPKLEEIKVEERKIFINADSVEVETNNIEDRIKLNLKFRDTADAMINAMSFLMQTKIDDLDEVQDCLAIYGDFRDRIIQILEEKFGINVKRCWTCKDYTPLKGYTSLKEECKRGVQLIKGETPCPIISPCEHWKPKEKEASERGGHAFDGDPASHVRPPR